MHFKRFFPPTSSNSLAAMNQVTVSIFCEIPLCVFFLTRDSPNQYTIVLTGMLLGKRMLLKYSITMVFPCHHPSWYKVSSPLRENDNFVFPFPFQIIQLANLWSSIFKDSFPILKTRRCPDIYPLTRHPRRFLAGSHCLTLGGICTYNI